MEDSSTEQEKRSKERWYLVMMVLRSHRLNKHTNEHTNNSGLWSDFLLLNDPSSKLA